MSCTKAHRPGVAWQQVYKRCSESRASPGVINSGLRKHSALTEVYSSKKGGISASVGEAAHKQQGDAALAQLSECYLPACGIQTEASPSEPEFRV